MDSWSSSTYYNSLEDEARRHYKRKLQLSDGTQLPDPFMIAEWKSDVALLPDIGWADMYNYLIHSPSTYTHQSLKSYKSLEAYNFFLCGHVQDIFYCGDLIKDSKFCCIKTKVSLCCMT